MSGNTFGSVFKVTTYGESHGPGLGGVVDGCPSGIPLTEEMLQLELDRRKPGHGGAGGVAATARQEADQVRILSGVFDGVTTGTPIGFHVENQDQRSRDYSKIKDVYRPGHADLSYDAKYGIRDYRGGGRSSGRETLSRVAAGAIARQVLAHAGITVLAYPVAIGGIAADIAPDTVDPDTVLATPFFAPDSAIVGQWEERIKQVKSDGDTLGGLVRIEARGVPAGLGEPVFDKLDARLAYACMGVGAVKAVEIGSGRASADALGSNNNDPITPEGFQSNHAGGILGGISSGQTIIVTASVKPIPSISQEQTTVTTSGQATTITIGGRHDICAIPRIVPVLNAMVMLTLADALLLQKRMG